MAAGISGDLLKAQSIQTRARREEAEIRNEMALDHAESNFRVTPGLAPSIQPPPAENVDSPRLKEAARRRAAADEEFERRREEAGMRPSL